MSRTKFSIFILWIHYQRYDNLLLLLCQFFIQHFRCNKLFQENRDKTLTRDHNGYLTWLMIVTMTFSKLHIKLKQLDLMCVWIIRHWCINHWKNKYYTNNDLAISSIKHRKGGVEQDLVSHCQNFAYLYHDLYNVRLARLQNHAWLVCDDQKCCIWHTYSCVMHPCGWLNFLGLFIRCLISSKIALFKRKKKMKLSNSAYLR